MFRDIIIDSYDPHCPIRNVLARIGEKWSMLVLYTLSNASKPMRYSDIGEKIPDLSQKMLTVTLRNLEADGLVVRTAYAEVPPRVEYSITERGITLMPHINSLIGWALDNFSDIIKTRNKYYQSKNNS